MSHYFTKQEGEYDTFPVKFYLKKRKLNLELKSAPGIFSKDKLDLGSELLLNHCLIQPGWRMLDLGCGYGAVGISLALIEDVTVDMVDVNLRAVKVARQNIKDKKLKERVRGFESNIYEKIVDKYDSILINPPQTAGKGVCNKMIVDAKEHLNEGGCVQVVARHQKGGKGFETLMNETYGNVEVLAKGSGFRVYVSKI